MSDACACVCVCRCAPSAWLCGCMCVFGTVGGVSAGMGDKCHGRGQGLGSTPWAGSLRCHLLRRWLKWGLAV